MTKTLKIKNGDMVRSVFNNGYEMVSGRDKVKQDVNNILTTDVRKTTGLGCDLDELIGMDSDNPASIFSPSPVMFEFQMRVSGGLNVLMSTQKEYLYGSRPSSELIFAYTPVEIWPIGDDPRNFRWRVNISTVDGKSGFTVSGKTR